MIVMVEIRDVRTLSDADVRKRTIAGEAEEKTSDDAEAHNVNVSARRKAWAKAIECIELAMRRPRPPDKAALPEIFYNLGVAFAWLQKHEEAEKAFTSVIDLHIGSSVHPRVSFVGFRMR
jgi:hypothetical protein